jgi:hypothetical protein
MRFQLVLDNKLSACVKNAYLFFDISKETGPSLLRSHVTCAVYALSYTFIGV